MQSHAHAKDMCVLHVVHTARELGDTTRCTLGSESQRTCKDIAPNWITWDPGQQLWDFFLGGRSKDTLKCFSETLKRCTETQNSPRRPSNDAWRPITFQGHPQMFQGNP